MKNGFKIYGCHGTDAEQVMKSPVRLTTVGMREPPCVSENV
jgi:hypothetical protein